MLDSAENVVTAYTYGPYGEVTTTVTSTIAEINPLRYRGYYYDTETNLYYLSSRYYDSNTGRFICADEPDMICIADYFETSNLYSYCNNNPIAKKDVSGNFGVFALGFIGAIAGGLVNYAGQVINNYQNGMSGAEAWSDVNWGKVASSAISGAVAAIPGSGAVGAAVEIVGGNLVEHAYDALAGKKEFSIKDLGKDIIEDSIKEAFIPDIIPTRSMPKFIRDIKQSARAAGVKGKHKLQQYLNITQIETIAVNSFLNDIKDRLDA